MPIKWNALMVSEAVDMVEEYVNQAIEPLEQAKLVATEARKIPNLPGYIDQHLSHWTSIEHATAGNVPACPPYPILDTGVGGASRSYVRPGSASAIGHRYSRVPF